MLLLPPHTVAVTDRFKLVPANEFVHPMLIATPGPMVRMFRTKFPLKAATMLSPILFKKLIPPAPAALVVVMFVKNEDRLDPNAMEVMPPLEMILLTTMKPAPGPRPVAPPTVGVSPQLTLKTASHPVPTNPPTPGAKLVLEPDRVQPQLPMFPLSPPLPFYVLRFL